MYTCKKEHKLYGLYMALLRMDLDKIKKELKNKVVLKNINVVDKSGENILFTMHWAYYHWGAQTKDIYTEKRGIEVVKMFKKTDLNFNQVNNANLNILHLFDGGNYPKLWIALARAGADPMHKLENDKTAVDYIHRYHKKSKTVIIRELGIDKKELYYSKEDDTGD